ncbi:uncharacterized protein (DUF2342 family) [Pedobacter sp. W3I1]|uniref:hypothetical protein n=1 Tax=Pedobacter sp. W3I1 TaxID=3042291 RepID=UPI00277D81A6|nr:hypothetical protein [Pedobacter sp. W3I1]MDQ0638482.1 uncharacterized protein (DUF2342 family) [Pedobacter sp. W3I1]
MENDNIQEYFTTYIELLDKIHTLGHEIDASVIETDIEDIIEKRLKYKTRMDMISKKLITALKDKGNRYPVYNALAQKNTLLSVIDGKLEFNGE